MKVTQTEVKLQHSAMQMIMLEKQTVHKTSRSNTPIHPCSHLSIYLSTRTLACVCVCVRIYIYVLMQARFTLVTHQGQTSYECISSHGLYNFSLSYPRWVNANYRSTPACALLKTGCDYLKVGSEANVICVKAH